MDFLQRRAITWATFAT